MYLLAKFGGYRTYGNGTINSYINSYMHTSDKAELTALICHIKRLLESGILIYNSEVPDMAGRKQEEQGEEKEQRQSQSVIRFKQKQ